MLRESREQARLKFLFLKHGWNAETFLSEIHRRLGFHSMLQKRRRCPRIFIAITPVCMRRNSQDISTLEFRCCVAGFSAGQLHAVARAFRSLCRRRSAHHSNAKPVDRECPRSRIRRPCGAKWKTSDLQVEASQFWRGAVACTGTEFCKLAITETKSFARWVVEELEGRVPGFDQQLKLNITGCPNSCGQHWIADLGLEGKKIKVDGQFADAYYFCVGGSVGRVQSIARPVGYRCLATEVPESITRLLSRYTELRESGESLQQFLARKSNDEIRGFLAGGAAEVAARDLPAAPVPHGVEG